MSNHASSLRQPLAPADTEALARELAELIEVTPEISDNCRSSGAATDVAIVSAFAPGNWADIWTVGISTCGTPAIGSRK